MKEKLAPHLIELLKGECTRDSFPTVVQAFPEVIPGVIGVKPVPQDEITDEKTAGYVIEAEIESKHYQMVIGYHRTSDGDIDNGEDNISYLSVVKALKGTDDHEVGLERLQDWFLSTYPEALHQPTIQNNYLLLGYIDVNGYINEGIVDLVTELFDLLPKVATKAKEIFS